MQDLRKEARKYFENMTTDHASRSPALWRPVSLSQNAKALSLRDIVKELDLSQSNGDIRQVRPLITTDEGRVLIARTAFRKSAGLGLVLIRRPVSSTRFFESRCCSFSTAMGPESHSPHQGFRRAVPVRYRLVSYDIRVAKEINAKSL